MRCLTWCDRVLVVGLVYLVCTDGKRMCGLKKNLFLHVLMFVQMLTRERDTLWTSCLVFPPLTRHDRTRWTLIPQIMIFMIMTCAQRRIKRWNVAFTDLRGFYPHSQQQSVNIEFTDSVEIIFWGFLCKHFGRMFFWVIFTFAVFLQNRMMRLKSTNDFFYHWFICCSVVRSRSSLTSESTAEANFQKK